MGWGPEDLPGGHGAEQRRQAPHSGVFWEKPETQLETQSGQFESSPQTRVWGCERRDVEETP